MRGVQVYKRRCSSRFMWNSVKDPDFPSEKRSGVDNVHALISAQADLAVQLCVELNGVCDMCSARAHFGMRDLRRVLGYILDASCFFRYPIFRQGQEASCCLSSLQDFEFKLAWLGDMKVAHREAVVKFDIPRTQEQAETLEVGFRSLKDMMQRRELAKILGELKSHLVRFDGGDRQRRRASPAPSRLAPTTHHQSIIANQSSSPFTTPKSFITSHSHQQS